MKKGATILKAITGFSIIPKEDRKQALRIRRFFMAFAAYLLYAFLGYVSFIAGVLEWQAMAGFLLMIPTVNATFYIIFRTGLNRKASDPSLTSIQMCTAILVITHGMYYANQARGSLLLTYVVVLLFGIFRLNTRQFLFISVFTLIIYAGDIVLLYFFRLYDVNFRMEFFQWLALAIVLFIFSLIGGYISSLRMKLNLKRAELERSLSLIREMVIRDDLTGLHNRRHLMELLEYETNRSARDGAAFTIAMLDIDHFKNVNDIYGHLIGDQVLCKISNIIRDTLRSSDFCGRYGGEEFMLVFTQTDARGAITSAERVRDVVENICFADLGIDHKITVSLGLTEHRLREDLDVTISRADEALYRAKKSGRNRVVYSN